jgi:hypothetical protein
MGLLEFLGSIDINDAAPLSSHIEVDLIGV